MPPNLAIPEDLRAMLEVVRRNGRPRLVGGGVRDWLLGLAPNDFDIEVSGIDFETLHRTLAPFGPTDIVGRSFGVIKVRSRATSEEYDFSLPRRESKTGAGHRGFIVAPDPAALPEVLVYDARRIKSFHDSYENFVDNATLIHVIGQWVGKLQEDAVVRKEEVPSLLGMVSHMVIAHSATTEEEITVLHGFIEQVAPAVEEDISTSLLRNMKEALSPTYEGRIIV
jgi:hypothetical protein